jgi:hypothetical protein
MKRRCLNPKDRSAGELMPISEVARRNGIPYHQAYERFRKNVVPAH